MASSKLTNKNEGYCSVWVIYSDGEGETVLLLHNGSNEMHVWNTVNPLGIISYYSHILWLKSIENYHNLIQGGLLMA